MGLETPMNILRPSLRFVHLIPASKPLPAPAASRPAALDWPESPDIDGDTWEDGPDPADDQWHAEHNTDHHATEPTPDDALGDGPEPDWDGMAEESAALDRLCRGCLL
jgi:hypothetical protein